MIGNTIYEDTRTKMKSWVLFVNSWELQVERLIAHCFDFNLSSARVLEKSGFKLEGFLRKHYRKDGKLFDARCYGLLKEDLARAHGVLI